VTAGVTQTILAGDPSGRPGNCLQAAVATLLNLPLDRVPHFVESGDDWLTEMIVFAETRGYRTEWRTKDEPLTFGLMFGPTVRSADLHHAVAVVDGVMWDPHPSRAGLTEAFTYIAFVAVEGGVVE
jgi:hypothetical protein